jgi:hypothetical protein
MMYTQDGKLAMPITEENENVKFFASAQEARVCAFDHIYCKAFGFEIFNMNEGGLS